MKKCMFCGAENSEMNSCCSSCGKPLDNPAAMSNTPAGGGPRLTGSMGRRIYSRGSGDTSGASVSGNDKVSNVNDPWEEEVGSWTGTAPSPGSPTGGSRLTGQMGGKVYHSSTEEVSGAGERKASNPWKEKEGSRPDTVSSGYSPSASSSRLKGNMSGKNWGGETPSGSASSAPGPEHVPSDFKFCPHCGFANPFDAAFCEKCGKSMKSGTNSTKARNIAIAVACLLVAIGVVLLLTFGFNSGSDITISGPTTPPPTTQPTETQAPTTQPPETQAPTTQPLETQPPTTQPPTTQPSATQSDVPLWLTEPYNPRVWRSNLMTTDPLGVFKIDKEFIQSVEFKSTTFDFTTDDVIWNLGKGSSQRVIGKVDWIDKMAHITIAADGAINAELCAEGLFEGCTNLESIYGLEVLRVMDADRLDRMFYGCEKLSYLGFNGPSWNTSKIISMSEMFRECKSLTEPYFAIMKYWDTSSVTSMYAMFSTCTSLENLDLSMFDTSNVANMGFMFSACKKLRRVDVSSFNTSRVTNMEGMFRWCDLLEEPDLSGWNIAKVTNYSNFMNEGMTIQGRPWKEFFR